MFCMWIIMFTYKTLWKVMWYKMKDPNKIINQEKHAIEELHSMLKGKDQQFKQKVLDTIKGMTLMHDYYKNN